MASHRFSSEVESTLRHAGWSPARHADITIWTRALAVDGGFVASCSAEAALTEFGGLKIEQHGAGVECARESFDLDPLVAAGYETEFRRVEESVGDKHLFPLGEVGGGQVFLAIGSSGSVYYLMESVGLLGRSIEEALTSLIEGRKPLQVWDIDMTTSPGD